MDAELRRDSQMPVRQRAVWRVLTGVLDTVAQDRPRVLDCGGGSGSFAVPLAVEGADVTVVDISVDALATLQRRAAEAAVADRVHAVQADVEALHDAGPAVPQGSFDLALAHGVLEEVDDIPATIGGIAATLRAGGHLSVVVGNPVAGVLARAFSGDIQAALEELRVLDGPDQRSAVAAVRAACVAAGLEVVEVHGVGVFSELVPGAALDLPGAVEALAELEAEAAGRPPFVDIASRVHLLARRRA